MEVLAVRESELNTIYKYSGQGFLATYALGFAGLHAIRRGRLPFFRDVIKHSILGVGGTFVFARTAEKIAAEMYYNKVLI